MNEILTIVEHQSIAISKNRDISNSILSYEDRELLFDIEYTDKKGNKRFLFSNNGKNKIKACSIVGSVSLKNGLTVEILPKFAKGNLTKVLKKQYRETLIGMIRVSNEKNFITTQSQSGKISMGEMPLINYIIELFTSSLVNTLRQGLHQTYTKNIKNTSNIRGNILVSKTIQNNFIDKSKVYCQYNKHSSNNLLMQVFKTLSKLLMQDDNLSYNTKQNLYEVHLLLDGVETINLKPQDFNKVVFNRLNDKYEILFNQANFIFNKYMPFSSKINSTPFWSILFSMDYLFEKFLAYLFRKSNINFTEQSTINCFENKSLDMMVSAKPDFVIEDNLCVADAKWKLLQRNKTLYGLNAQNFWQLFSYMNLINSTKQISGYFIVPKNNDSFEDEIVFDPIVEGNKSITIISIDFSLPFKEIIDNFYFTLLNKELKYKKKLVLKDSKKDLAIFDFEKLIEELELLSKNKNYIKTITTLHKEKFPNILKLKDIQNVTTRVFKEFIKDNINRETLALDDLNINTIPKNIKKLKKLTTLKIQNNNITSLPVELFLLKKLTILDISDNKLCNINSNIEKLQELKTLKINDNASLKISSQIFKLKKLKEIVVDKNIIDMNIDIFQNLLKSSLRIVDKNNIDLTEYIKVYKIKEFVICTECDKEKEKISFEPSRLHKKSGYKTGVCRDCVKLEKNKRDKDFEPVLRERYRDIKQKAQENKKELSFTVEEFLGKFKNDDTSKTLYTEWVNSEINGKRNQDLKPNIYLINDQSDFNFENIGIATSREVQEINKDNKIHKIVVQLTLDNEPIGIYKSGIEASRYTKIPDPYIYKSCNNLKNNEAKGYRWQFLQNITQSSLIHKVKFLKDSKIFDSKINELVDEKYSSMINNSKNFGNSSYPTPKYIPSKYKADYIEPTEDKLSQCYSNNIEDIKQLSLSKDLREDLKIVLFFREYESLDLKSEIQNLLIKNSSDEIVNNIFIKDIKYLVSYIENEFHNIYKLQRSWIYGFILCPNNQALFRIKVIIAKNTTSQKILGILSNEKNEKRILNEVANNINSTTPIINKIVEFTIENNYIHTARTLVKRDNINLESLKKLVDKFEDSSLVNLIKDTIDHKKEKALIKDWLEDKFPEPILTLNNYDSFSNDKKYDFAIEAKFNTYPDDLIKKLCYEDDNDILIEILADKHDSLKLRFVMLIYILNFKNIDFKNKEIFPALEKYNNEHLKIIIELSENYGIQQVSNYIKSNFNDIDNEILLGYAMSNVQSVFYVRDIICELTNQLDILNELSKNEDDEIILRKIIFKAKDNKDFQDIVKGYSTIYSTEILTRIAKYEQYYEPEKEYCLITQLAKDYFNTTIQTKNYLFSNYAKLNKDKTLLNILHQSIKNSTKKELERLNNLIINVLNEIKNNFSNKIEFK